MRISIPILAQIGAALGLIGSVPAGSLEAQPARSRDRLSTYLEAARRDWNVAGMVVAVVKGDSVVYARGFGQRDVRRPEPVDTATVFPIGSITKFFTAVAAGILVDSGRMAWDRPLGDYLPGFATADPWVSAHLTLRDALTHRTGLDWRLDFIWFNSSLTTDQIVERIRDFGPEPDFRARYGYSNVMFAAAGSAVAKVSGQSWQEFVTRRLLQPLGMRRTAASPPDPTSDGNVAVPHTNFDGAPRPVEKPLDLGNTAPAGAIRSTAGDMLRWLRFALGGGQLEGKRLISEATLREILSPQVVVGPAERVLQPMSNFMLYGMGVEILDYRGRRAIKHGGRVDGGRTEFALVPDAGLGVVILTNTTGPAGVPDLTDPVLYRVLDHYLAAEEVDWNGKFLESRRATIAARQARTEQAAAGRIAGTRPTLTLDRYAGRYAGPIGTSAAGTERAGRLGPFGQVSVENGRLHLRYGPFDTVLEHWHHDTYRFDWPLGGPLFATFILDGAGGVDRLRIDAVGELVRVGNGSSDPGRVPPS